MNVEIDVQNNGDMIVTETQKYVFNREQPNQRYRYISLDKVDDIKDITVSENNQIIPHQVGNKNNQLWIRWQHELNPPESHTFVIKYRVIGGLHVNYNTAQVYWKAIFSDRKSQIQNAKVTVRLPESLAVKIKSFTYYAANIPVSSQKIDDQTVEFIVQKPIPRNKELEVKVTFPNNILDMQKPEWQQSGEFSKSRNQVKNRNLSFIEFAGYVLASLILIFFLIRFILFFLPGRKTSHSSQSSSKHSGSAGSAGGASGGGCGGGSGGGGGGGFQG